MTCHICNGSGYHGVRGKWFNPKQAKCWRCEGLGYLKAEHEPRGEHSEHSGDPWDGLHAFDDVDLFRHRN